MDMRVPGYDTRAWSRAELDTIARRMLALHLPEPKRAGIGREGCLMCETSTPCAERRWARRWLRQRVFTGGRWRRLFTART